MKKIKIKCRSCEKIYEVDREEEISEDVISLTCNLCPDCEDAAEENYEEEYCYEAEKTINYPQLNFTI